MFFIQVLQVDFLADFQFTQVYTGLLFLPPDVPDTLDIHNRILQHTLLAKLTKSGQMLQFCFTAVSER